MKFTVAAPAAAVIVEGIVMLALLLERTTPTPAAGAAKVRTTVQVDVPGELTVAGEQLNELGCTGTVKLIDVDWVSPFSDAETVTF
jgi:hypothetical protein